MQITFKVWHFVLLLSLLYSCQDSNNTNPQLVSTMTNTLPFDYYKGIAPDLESFTLVNEIELSQILKNIENNPILNNYDIPVDYDLSPDNSEKATWKYFQIVCSYPVNCIVRASLKIKNPYGGPELWKFIWEFADKDKKSKYLLGYIGGMGEVINSLGEIRYYDIRLTAERSLWLRELNNKSAPTGITIKIGVETKSRKSQINPYSWDITNGLNIHDKQILQELLYSKPLPSELSQMTLQMFIPPNGIIK
jgi:hypothetical protein